MICNAVTGGISLRQVYTKEQFESDPNTIVTLNTPNEHSMDTPITPETEYDSASSSAWDDLSDSMETPSAGYSCTRTRTRTDSQAYLPRFHPKRNEQSTIASFSSLRWHGTDESTSHHSLDQERESHHLRDSTELFYDDILFYPHNNLQSLLFSHIHPFTTNDYRCGCPNGDAYTESDNECEELHTSEDAMDWSDAISVNRFKELMSKLLITASYGIREDEIYLMFSSPSPNSIITHLRFGLLSDLCDVHFDRFGRRSYYHRHTQNTNVPVLYAHSSLPSDLGITLLKDATLGSFWEESSSPCGPPPNNHQQISTDNPDRVSTSSSQFKVSPSKQSVFDYVPYCVKNHPIPRSSPIHNESYSPIPVATPLHLKCNTVMNSCNPFANAFPEENDIDESHGNEQITSQHPFELARASSPRLSNSIVNKIRHSAKEPFIFLRNASYLSCNRSRRNAFGNNSITNTFHDQMYAPHTGQSKHMLPLHKRKIEPKRPLPRRPPKPQLRDSTKKKVKQTKERMKKKRMEMSVSEFHSINLSDLLADDSALMATDNNYELAKGIAHFFDEIFGDKDTVCIVSGANKEPDLSYWLKRPGDYIRKTQNVGQYAKTVCVYRACAHSKAKEPILSQKEFESYVREICEKNNNECVKVIGDLLDTKFGCGVHFARSTLKRCDYDVYCRYSDHYECSFRMSSGAYIVAWRR